MPDLDQNRSSGDWILFQENQLFIAGYQKSFAWAGKRVSDYFTHIKSAIWVNGKEYFPGSIMARYKDPLHSGNVDGKLSEW
jgi:hypothetical protein